MTVPLRAAPRVLTSSWLSRLDDTWSAPGAHATERRWSALWAEPHLRLPQRRHRNPHREEEAGNLAPRHPEREEREAARAATPLVHQAVPVRSAMSGRKQDAAHGRGALTPTQRVPSHQAALAAPALGVANRPREKARVETGLSHLARASRVPRSLANTSPTATARVAVIASSCMESLPLRRNEGRNVDVPLRRKSGIRRRRKADPPLVGRVDRHLHLANPLHPTARKRRQRPHVSYRRCCLPLRHFLKP